MLALLEENARLRAEAEHTRALMLDLEEAQDDLRVEHNRMARMARHLQRAVELAEAADVAKSDFLARMSHELRTPLHAVLAMAELMQGTELDPMQQEYAQTIETAGQALLALINDILDLSKIEAGNIALNTGTFDPSALLSAIDRCLQPIARKAGVSLSLDLDESSRCALLGDDARIRQILTNLIGNAIKFSPEGQVEVLAACEPPAGSHRDLVVIVQDNGIGIAKEHLAGLFERVGAPHRIGSGAGLGLAISKHLADLMGGVLSVDSEEGRGSRFEFRVSLPITERRASTMVPEHPATTARDEQRRALVVDDNRVNQKVAQRMLERLGFDVLIATNGREALSCYQSHPARHFDIILMDCQMPIMDGYEATRVIRMFEDESRPGTHVPIVALTAHAMSGDQHLCLEAGMDEYQTKPLSLDRLEGLLARVAAGELGVDQGGPASGPPSTD